jgi:hypothetical protein
MEVSLAAADVLVTINKIVNFTVSLVGNVLAIVFYIVFSPFICLLMLIYSEPAEPEELVELMEPEEPFEQSEESKKITPIRF